MPAISRSLTIGAAAAAAVLGLRVTIGHGPDSASAAAPPRAVPTADAVPTPAPPPPILGPAPRLEMSRYLTSQGMDSLLEEGRRSITDGDRRSVVAAAASAHDAALFLRRSGDDLSFQR